MKLYMEVLIESAAQAEALPIGTVALLRFGHRTKTTGGWWETPTGGGLDESRAVVGAQALVPIEVEAFQSEPLSTTHLVEGITGPGPFTVYVTQGDDS